MNIKNISGLSRVNDMKSNGSILMDAPQDGHMYGRQDGEWVLIKRDSCDSQIKTIDLTKTSKRISIWDYMERDEIQTFSDMMLDYLNTIKITDYKTDKFYAEYVPDLVDIKIEVDDIEKIYWWEDIFSVRGFFDEKIRTAHIIEKETNVIVAKVNYISNDYSYDFFNNIKEVFSYIIPVEPTNIDYYINMLNYGLKNGIKQVYMDEDGELGEYDAFEKVEPKILSLMGYPFDKKRIQLFLVQEIKNEYYHEVDFMCAIDLPTGFIPPDKIYCNGQDEWVDKPDSIR